MTVIRRNDEQEEQRRKSRAAGIKLLIGAGLGLPAYVFASLQTYGHLKTVPAIIAFTVCAVCIVLGVRSLILTRR